jgi:hypothetical protein
MDDRAGAQVKAFADGKTQEILADAKLLEARGLEKP